MSQDETGFRYVRIRESSKKYPTPKRFSTDQRLFEAGRWYKVSRRLAERLSMMHTDYQDPKSPPMFDVLTESQALKVKEDEERAEAVKRDPFANVQTVSGASEKSSGRVLKKAPPVNIEEVIPNYDDLSISKIKPYLDALSPRELAAVLEYEKSNAERSTLIKAIEGMLEEDIDDE